ncbi:putative quinol monooxygenase [Halosegnis marinus]|uniref:Quinol monooxygenase n=1 Tax=Halosegnis marinus TaxID=3034023 RepID=A0ABD5ZLU2_9EURY|nr:putative quinol monooxygenase [Halosegnis sp. DT85]
MIVQHATIPIDPESRDAAVEALTELGEASRAEEGVVEYRVTTDIDDENTVRIVEQYEDDAAVDAHMTSDHFEAFQEELPAFVGGDVELVRFDVAETTQLM